MFEQVIAYDAAAPVVLATKGSVGQHGNNYFEDTKLMQSMLNNVAARQGGPLTKLAVDGSPGPLTIAAIKRFQSANGCVVDGRIDARGKTARKLVEVQVASGAPLPKFAGLRPATTEELAPVLAGARFPASRIKQANRDSQTTQAFARQSLAVGGSSGFGAPFTRAGWTIDNSVGSFDFSVKDTGAYFSRMTIFRDDDNSDRFNLTMAGIFKSIGIKDGPPIGFDWATPSMTSTTGVVFRGLAGFGPISRASFAGLCGIAFASINVQTGHGASLVLFQFQWIPAGPPGGNTGFAFMLGEQKGMPGPSAGAGSAIALPV
jgi:peptidoglycan hydrolase-like protein with peptidoglycan-binding domain